MDKPNFYSIIPAYVRYSNRINSFEKLLYSEITALSDKNGYCFASNQYFAKVFDMHKNSISRSITKLEQENFIKISIDQEKGNFRKIYLTNILPINKKVDSNSALPINKNGVTPINKNEYYNNTSINNLYSFNENEKNNDDTIQGKKEKTNKKEKIEILLSHLKSRYVDIEDQLKFSLSTYLKYREEVLNHNLPTHTINLLADKIVEYKSQYSSSEIIKSINRCILSEQVRFNPEWNDKKIKSKKSYRNKNDIYDMDW